MQSLGGYAHHLWALISAPGRTIHCVIATLIENSYRYRQSYPVQDNDSPYASSGTIMYRHRGGKGNWWAAMPSYRTDVVPCTGWGWFDHDLYRIRERRTLFHLIPFYHRLYRSRSSPVSLPSNYGTLPVSLDTIAPFII